jgi:hypothetical protein
MTPEAWQTPRVPIHPESLGRKVLTVAGDNDGLWDFAKLLREDATSQEAYEQLRPVIVTLVRDGLLAIEDGKGAQLSTNEACDLLERRPSWVLPWEPDGDWHSGADAFGVSLTSDGEAALDQPA